MADSNPILIHAGPTGSRRAPLFLMHDGGGTIFHYFLLKPLNRAVYGIRNPRCQPGQEWEGGLHQMADEYLSLIKPIAQRRPILLGGALHPHPSLSPREMASRSCGKEVFC
jgi:hypothetical protein